MLHSVSGSAEFPRDYEHGVNNQNETFVKEIRLRGGSLADFTTSYTNFRGYLDRVEGSDGGVTQRRYNSLGQLDRLIDPDGVVTRYKYDPRGRLEFTTVGADRDNWDALGGTDRIVRQNESFVPASDATAGNQVVARTTTQVWPESTGTPSLSQVTERTLDGRRSWTTVYAKKGAVDPRVTQVETTCASGTCVTVTKLPDGCRMRQTKVQGRETLLEWLDSTGSVLASRASFDDDLGQGRLYRQTDSRTGTVYFGWNEYDELEWEQRPGPAGKTEYRYDRRGRRCL